jgi:hypothetical protein
MILKKESVFIHETKGSNSFQQIYKHWIELEIIVIAKLQTENMAYLIIIVA